MNFVLSVLISSLSIFSAINATDTFVIDSPVESLSNIEFLVEGVPSNKLLVLLHGAGSNGIGLREMDIEWRQYWVNKGYSVAAISMPGFGKTAGNKDFCGSLTIQTISHVIEHLKNMFAFERIGIIGHGQGAQAALLVSAKRHDIQCVVASGGVVNLISHVNKDNDLLISILIDKQYSIDCNNEKELKAHSPVYFVDNMQSPVFLLYRDQHPIIFIEEVEEFVHAMQTAGKKCTLIVREKTPEVDAQRISYQEIIDAAEEWIDTHMND